MRRTPTLISTALLIALASACPRQTEPSDAGAQPDAWAESCEAQQLIDCDGQCIDPMQNNEHCGATQNCQGPNAGEICDMGAGFLCYEGVCLCTSPERECDGVCTNTNLDPYNCGWCGNTCYIASGEECTNGHCLGDCGPPTLLCPPNGCVNINTDPANCGSCGHACDTANGFSCVAGECACTGDLTDCNGVCTNIPNDPANCGSCDNACDVVNGFSCVNGECSCTGVQTDCFGVCTNIQVDPNNCGECGNACNIQYCEVGNCDFDCSPSQALCNWQCVDLNWDRSNCGSCGHACAQWQVCRDGTCVGEPPEDAGIEDTGHEDATAEDRTSESG